MEHSWESVLHQEWRYLWGIYAAGQFGRWLPETIGVGRLPLHPCRSRHGLRMVAGLPYCALERITGGCAPPPCGRAACWGLLERIRIEFVSNLHADAALTLWKKHGFSVRSVAGSSYRDGQSNPHFQCGIALCQRALTECGMAFRHCGTGGKSLRRPLS